MFRLLRPLSQRLHLNISYFQCVQCGSGGGAERLGQFRFVGKEEEEEEGRGWVNLARHLIISLRQLFALVLTAGTGRQNPLHKVFGPPGD